MYDTMHMVLHNYLLHGTYALDDANHRIDYHVANGGITPEQAESLRAVAASHASQPSETDAVLAEMAEQVGQARQSTVEVAHMLTAIRPAVQTVAAETYSDAQLVAASDWFDAWRAGIAYDADTILRHGDGLYRVKQAVTAQEHQPPGGEGMLAVYAPIVIGAAGTPDDPIPYASGMDVDSGKYYTHAGGLYLAKADLKPCVWDPGTAGLWQWELVGA